MMNQVILTSTRHTVTVDCAIFSTISDWPADEKMIPTNYIYTGLSLNKTHHNLKSIKSNSFISFLFSYNFQGGFVCLAGALVELAGSDHHQLQEDKHGTHHLQPLSGCQVNISL